MSKRTLLAALAAAAAIILLGLVAAAITGRRPRAGRELVKKGGAPTPAEREDAAQALFGRAQLAADRREWKAVRRELQRLAREFAGTLFYAANQRLIARMLGQAEAKLEPPPPPPGKVEPPLPPGPLAPNVEHALANWPVVFQDDLDSKECLKKALLFKGQYGGHFDIREALIVGGVHTASAAWWNCPVGDAFLLSVDVRAFDNATPFIWLCGPGYGTSSGLGYLLRLPMREPPFEARLDRHGQPLGPPPHRAPLRYGQWYRLDILRHRKRIVVHLDGRPAGAWHDPVPLRGPMHAYVALGSDLGLFGKSGTWYRNLVIRMPDGEAKRLQEGPPQRMLDPPFTRLSEPNGRLLMKDEFGTGVLSRWLGTDAKWGIHERKEGLVLHGPNAWPAVWRRDAIAGPLALDIEMSYFPRGEAINFFVRLRFGEFIERKTQRFLGWTLGFPRGDGLVFLDWHDEQGHGRRVAQTAYFAPVHGRTYKLRFEWSRQRLRVFVNGGFLLEGRAPVPIPDGEPAYVGLRQIYGGSRVRRMIAWQIPARKEAARAAAPLVDFGPQLAATANFLAAFGADVQPLLADRRYVDAQVALTRLSVRPEFEPAAAAVARAEKDVDRLLRFWAKARPLAERNPDQNVLAVLGPAFLEDADSRLQAALFLLHDARGDPQRAKLLLATLPNNADARRYRALAARMIQRAAKAVRE